MGSRFSGALTSATRTACAGHLGHRLGRERDAAGEPPGAVLDHPDGETEVVGVAGAFEARVEQAERLGAHPFHAEGGELGAQFAGPLEGGVGQPPQRQGEEVGIDLTHAGILVRATRMMIWSNPTTRQPRSCLRRTRGYPRVT